MVALVIFALTASAIVKASGDHLSSVGQIEHITFATWVANNQLTHLTISSNWPVKNNQTGSEDMAGKTWYWKQKVEKTEDNAMVKVEVIVGTDSKLNNAVTSVSAFITKRN
ncbi:type II secretion system minor pseudopilin GspI [Paraglaciecola aquimarina]|uniref:Type II secretion system protein I n=1 Tax=Paraglaciecola aquimarina TaxID=1235557 RepID=A0ABU3STC0_9ALTE|nr:type II secretion system minor pseudopilin GspI [Paraglaciecola aquimarina]MDU0353227.1 type II secretion system minor pseudopilin GspI [Paraglaciecola aquimarina]